MVSPPPNYYLETIKRDKQELKKMQKLANEKDAYARKINVLQTVQERAYDKRRIDANKSKKTQFSSEIVQVSEEPSEQDHTLNYFWAPQNAQVKSSANQVKHQKNLSERNFENENKNKF